MTAAAPTPHHPLHIALLGGAFDPPTLGHLDAARFVLQHAPDVDHVWLVPPARHRFAKPMAPAHHRLAMCRLALEASPDLASAPRSVRVSDYELTHDLPGDTFTLLSRLSADPQFTPGQRFSFVIGQDNAASIDRWHKSTDLRALVPFIVLPRQGCPAPLGPRWETTPPHRALTGTRPILRTSSTEARHAAAAGDPARLSTLVCPAVAAYIALHRLYQPPTT